VFLEISEECKPGGPGHVWMFVGYGEALGIVAKPSKSELQCMYMANIGEKDRRVGS